MTNSIIKQSRRTDALGRAYAGSQLQIQIYVNRRRHELSKRILEASPALAQVSAQIIWVSPLEEEKFVEYKDKAFLKAIGLDHLVKELNEFWPRLL